ncbi:uncharacterized protein VICG_01407 [Vittaforma corneae ATCC 50505]|uniref:Uncharacterized protein n=1 Tax=Vittaforma corneae (strain ATCC 50505) TaxID=993615 RepID=L2GKY3_VITCO|nr:uncharacterized protein VICG_01407 [Vittaforma corneae ATCC 50505]ELA41543.1 hypothetical protein VICG_01407 [Vittaforma corneae ATCC 50505]
MESIPDGAAINSPRGWYDVIEKYFSPGFACRYDQRLQVLNQAGDYLKISVVTPTDDNSSLSKQIRSMFLSETINDMLRNDFSKLGAMPFQINFILDNGLFPLFGGYLPLTLLTFTALIMYFCYQSIQKRPTLFFILNVFYMCFTLVSLAMSDGYLTALFMSRSNFAAKAESNFKLFEYFVRLQSMEWILMNMFVIMTSTLTLFFHIVYNERHGVSKKSFILRTVVIVALMLSFILFYLRSNTFFDLLSPVYFTYASHLHLANIACGLIYIVCFVIAFSHLAYRRLDEII